MTDNAPRSNEIALQNHSRFNAVGVAAPAALTAATAAPRPKLYAVLIVDDDLTSREVLKAILQKEGFLVQTASNGLEGRLAAQRHHPDLVLLDIYMPGENGLETCALLKEDPATEDIPVVFISANEEVSSKVSGFNAGGVDYITKPYEAPEVIARVRLHIRLAHSYRSMVAASLEQLQRLSESQRSILVQPEELPQAAFACLYLPAQSAGGDFYDVIHAGEEIYDYLVADISGHDASTSLPMSALKALLRQNVALLYTPAENLNLVNRHLRPVLQEGQYVTLVYARLNRPLRRLTVVSAGHPPAVVLRAGQQTEVIRQSSEGLGLFDAITPAVFETRIEPGDRVFLFSDGLIEQDGSGAIARPAGLSRFLNMLHTNPSSALENTIEEIRKNWFPDPRNVMDDVVLLGFNAAAGNTSGAAR